MFAEFFFCPLVSGLLQEMRQAERIRKDVRGYMDLLGKKSPSLELGSYHL